MNICTFNAGQNIRNNRGFHPTVAHENILPQSFIIKKAFSCYISHQLLHRLRNSPGSLLALQLFAGRHVLNVAVRKNGFSRNVVFYWYTNVNVFSL